MEGFPISITDAEIVKALSRLRHGGPSALPDIYALTAAQLYPVMMRVLDNEDMASAALRSFYQMLSEQSRDPDFQPDMKDLIVMARRTALDYKMAGEPIHRMTNHSTSSSQSTRTTLNTSQANLLLKVLESSKHHHMMDEKTKERLETLQTQLKDLTGSRDNE